MSTTDRCLLGLTSQDCDEPVNSLALIDGKAAVHLDEEGHWSPVAGPTAHILAERTRHPHNRHRPRVSDHGRVLLPGVGLAADEQNARLPELMSYPVDSGMPLVTQKRDLAITEHLASPASRRALQRRRWADETKRGPRHASHATGLIALEASSQQFLNSTSTGRYLDFVCDEVVPFIDARYPTLSAREHRGVSGKSSGGYGAMVLSMLRPEVFGALASHAGDALFECCYQPLFPVAARLLRTQFHGSWEVFEARAQEADFDWKQSAALFAAYGTAWPTLRTRTAPAKH